MNVLVEIMGLSAEAQVSQAKHPNADRVASSLVDHRIRTHREVGSRIQTASEKACIAIRSWFMSRNKRAGDK